MFLCVAGIGKGSVLLLDFGWTSRKAVTIVDHLCVPNMMTILCYVQGPMGKLGDINLWLHDEYLGNHYSNKVSFGKT